ncbi:MAG: PhzF family phenazine biosynthesis protein [Alphaproteobacteria bacterium]|nr:PhzF family phenazine biosynthesis protein [Alphaproteobacteria bacterium]
MELPLVQVDAFATGPFTGNPAAVMRLPRFLDDEVLAGLAAENNLSETAFVVSNGGRHRLRWFTPTTEVELCGHATLAAGYVLLAEDGGDEVRFQTRSGELVVRRVAEQGAGHELSASDVPSGLGQMPKESASGGESEGNKPQGSRPQNRGAYALALPSHPPHAAEHVPPALAEALGHAPVEVLGIKALHRATYWLAVYRDEDEILALRPDTGRLLRELKANVVCTAPGREVDLVSRFFAPASGVDEDPVTGSAHATLTPFWSERLGRTTLTARQLSRRGGALTCTLDGDRVWLRGDCRVYLRGFAVV